MQSSLVFHQLTLSKSLPLANGVMCSDKAVKSHYCAFISHHAHTGKHKVPTISMFSHINVIFVPITITIDEMAKHE